MGARKHLSGDGLIRILHASIAREKLPELQGSTYTWDDCIMSAFAMFSLKFSSLLQFDASRKVDPVLEQNLHNLYGINAVPSDTTMRERLDRLSIKHLRRPFKKIFACLQRTKELERYQYLNGYYIIALDGTGQFSSKTIHCECCCEKHHRNGDVDYYHHMLGAALVHPDQKVVIPLAPEPIVKSDGDNKNDCERNAAKRLVSDLRREHPHLKILIVEDSLASNYPHLSLLDSLHMEYIVGVKEADHQHLFNWIKDIDPVICKQTDKNETQHEFKMYSNVPLNDANHNYRVNVLEYHETKKDGRKQHFSWVTKLELTKDNVYKVMRAARARWRIENETFNTLKNQGYNFEHNYGHGYKNLCSVMSMLMMLAFLNDQVQHLCCKSYRKAYQRSIRLNRLFHKILVGCETQVWDNWQQLLTDIAKPPAIPPPVGR